MNPKFKLEQLGTWMREIQVFPGFSVLKEIYTWFIKVKLKENQCIALYRKPKSISIK